MKFADFTDFKDFCKKNNFTPEEGLTFLENELKNKERN